MVNSRAKGVRGEHLWRDFLRERGYEARRGQQFCGDPTAPDVIGGPPDWHPEVKFVESLSVRKAMAQAESECGGKKPYVAWKTSRQPWLVTMRAEDFLALFGQPCIEGETAP